MLYTYCETTAELVAALGSNKMIALAAGTFNVSSQIDLSNLENLRIFGVGYATNLVMAVSTGTGIGGSNCTRISIENLRISGTCGRGISFTSGSQLEIRNVWVSGATASAAPASGIYLGNTNDSIIEGCFCSGNGIGASSSATSLDILVDGSSSRNKILNNSCTSTLVQFNIGVQTNGASQTCEENEIRGNYATGAQKKVIVPPNTEDGWGYGIFLYDGGTTPKGNLITGNKVEATQGIGIYIAGINTVVIGNTLDNNATSVVAHGPASLTIFSMATGCVVANNTIRNTTVHPAILALANDTAIEGNTLTNLATHAISIQSHDGTTTPDNISVIGNVITNLTVGGRNAINADRVEAPLIANNTIRACASHGINVDTCARPTISGNVITAGGTHSANSYSGIIVTGGNDPTILGNTISGSSYAYGITNNAVRANIAHNRMYGTGSSGTSGYNNTGTNSYRHGNQISSDSLAGLAQLSGGTVTVNSAEVRTGDVIRIDIASRSATPGIIAQGAIVSGTSFVINSSVATDDSWVSWEIVH